jgi:hypothetical protein
MIAVLFDNWRGRGSLAQTSWSIRVPCPGGSGAGAGGWTELASFESVLSITTGETIAAGCVLLLVSR